MATFRHFRSRRKGFSLAESLISIVIVGTLMVAALNTVGATTTGRSQVSRKAMAHGIGQAMLSEIMALPYEDPDQTPTFGLEPAENSANRLGFDDVDDYDDWNRVALEKRNGDPLLGMANWSRKVLVDWVSPADLATTSVSATDVKRITVSIFYNSVEMASFIGIRTPGPPDAPSPPKILYLTKGMTINTATTTELARISLLELWGYEVVTISVSEFQSDVDLQAADVVAIYISSEVNPAQMRADFSTTSKGIINENPDLLDDFGFSLSYSAVSTTRLNIWDNTHYITTPFVLGWMTIYTSSQPVQVFNGATSTDILYLGGTSNGGGATSFAGFGILNTGASMQGGGITAGRRVHLPWGQSAFDFNSLSANGQTIMQRSVAWAGGLDTP